MPIWKKEKLYIKTTLKNELADIAGISTKQLPPLLFTEHHQAHAASAFFPSPFNKAAILCMDGVGEWATTSVWLGEDNKMTPQWQIDFPHSLGLLYSAFTYYTGFKVNSGEYKLMGLAPYGEPVYANIIMEELLDLKADGTFRMNMEYFNFATGLSMTNDAFDKLFNHQVRRAETDITKYHMDIAASIQTVTEEVVLRLARTVKQELEVDYLCLAGGVGLNCVSNGRLQKEKIFKDIWIQPAAGDAGGSLGAALAVYYEYLQKERVVEIPDTMSGTYLGPKFSNEHIVNLLDSINAAYENLSEESLIKEVASILEQGKVVGWFQGRMEFGPRALGGRSILGDPRNKEMQSVMNLKIKYRESFRPFAPSVLCDQLSEFFDIEKESPYMLFVAEVNSEYKIDINNEDLGLSGFDRLKAVRSKMPAITHVDHSARIQTVSSDTNPRYYKLLKVFGEITGYPVLINTSFNVRGEPIVCTPEDAYRCFMNTDIDYLVLENCLLKKENQPQDFKDLDWLRTIEPD